MVNGTFCLRLNTIHTFKEFLAAIFCLVLARTLGAPCRVAFIRTKPCNILISTTADAYISLLCDCITKENIVAVTVLDSKELL